MKFLYENKLQILLITSVIFLSSYQAVFNFFRADDWTWLYVAQQSQINITQIFTLQLAGFFRPFNHLLFLFYYSLFGLNPVGYNIINILLNAINSILVYYIALKFTQNKSSSLIAALIFGIMAAHFDSLLFISGGMSDSSLFAFFFMLSFIFFLKWQETTYNRYLLYSLLVFVLNLLSYEGAIMFVPTLFLYILIFSKNINLRSIILSVKKILSYLVILIPYMVYQYIIQTSGTIAKLGIFSFGFHFLRNLLNYSVSLFTVFPLIDTTYLDRLNAPHVVYSLVNWAVLLLSVVLPLVGLYIIIKGSRVSRFFLGWYLIIFLPFLFFTTHITSRYTYTPSVGIAILLGILSIDVYKILARLWSPKLSKIIILVAVVTFIIFNIVSLNIIEAYKYSVDDDQNMVRFLQTTHPSFPKDSKIYFVNDTMPFKSPVLQMVMSLIYPQENPVNHKISADNTTYDIYYSSDFQIFEITRNQVNNVTRTQNVYIFDYIKTDYQTGHGVELS